MSTEEKSAARSLVPSTTREVVAKSTSLVQRGLVLAASELHRHEAEVYFKRGEEITGWRHCLSKCWEVIQNYTRAIELNPDYVEAYSARAFLYGYIEKYQEAIQDRTTVIELRPFDDNAYSVRALAYRRTRKYHEAILDYTRAIELAPQKASSRYGLRGETYEALGQYEKAIQDYTNISAYYSRGKVHHRLGHLEQAIHDYTQAMTDELWSEPCFYRGRAYEALGNYQEAMQSYTQVIELNLEFTDQAYMRRGDIYYQLEKYQEAIQDFSQAIEWLESPTVDVVPSPAGVYPVLLRPSHVTHAHRKHTAQKAFAYRRRADVDAVLNRYREAIQDYTKALALDPQYFLATRGLGKAYRNLLRLSKLHPPEPFVYWLCAVSTMNLGNNQEAIRECTQAIEIDTYYVWAYHTRAAAYGRLHMLPEAIQDLTKVIALKPEDAETYWLRAVAHHHLDQWEQALKNYQHAAGLGYEPAQSYLREHGWQW